LSNDKYYSLEQLADAVAEGFLDDEDFIQDYLAARRGESDYDWTGRLQEELDNFFMVDYYYNQKLLAENIPELNWISDNTLAMHTTRGEDVHVGVLIAWTAHEEVYSILHDRLEEIWKTAENNEGRKAENDKTNK